MRYINRHGMPSMMRRCRLQTVESEWDREERNSIRWNLEDEVGIPSQPNVDDEADPFEDVIMEDKNEDDQER